MHNNDSPSERLENTIALNTLSILNGADIIRRHDVESHINSFNFKTIKKFI